MKPTCRWRSWVIFPFFCWACCNPATTAPRSFFFFFPRRPTLFIWGFQTMKMKLPVRPFAARTVAATLHIWFIDWPWYSISKDTDVIHFAIGQLFFFSNHKFFYYKMNNMHKWTHIFLRKPRRSPDPAAFGNTNKKVGRLDSSRRDDKKKRILLCIKV